MNTNNTPLVTSYPSAVAGAGNVGVTMLENGPHTRLISGYQEPSLSKVKGISQHETGPSLLLSDPSIPKSTYESSSQPTTGAQQSTSSGTPSGQPRTGSPLRSEKSYQTHGSVSAGLKLPPEPGALLWEKQLVEDLARHGVAITRVDPGAVFKQQIASRGLPIDDKARKALPIFTYLTEYFPDATLAEVGVAVAGNVQHNPGQPLHWAREKSKDQLNTAFRHLWDHKMGKTKDVDGQYHLAKAIWRLKAELQLTIEAERSQS